MAETGQKSIARNWGAAAFFVLLYLYVWLRIDTRLFFESGPWFPPFSPHPSEIGRFFFYPGGPTEGLAAAFSQSYVYAWAGALVITLAALLLSITTGSYLRALNPTAPRWLSFIPPILVVVIYGSYGQHFASLVAVLLVTALAGAYARIPQSWVWPRSALFVVLSPFVYFALGGPYLLLALLCAMSDLRTRQGRLPGLVCLLSAEVVPYAIGVNGLGFSGVGFAVEHAYLHLLPFHWSVDILGRLRVLALYLFVPIAAFAMLRVPDWNSLLGRVSDRLGLAQVRPALRVTLVALLIIGPVVLSFDNTQHVVFQTEYYSRSAMWEQILPLAHRVRPEQYTLGLAHNINRALAQSGRMSEEMFSYPQTQDGLMMGVGLGTPASEYVQNLRKELFFQMGDLDLTLGLVNDAEHDAHEALEVYGPHGVTLKRLAMCNIAKGQVDAARVFLRVLSRDLFRGSWARQTLAQLEADPKLSTDPVIMHVRENMLADEVGYLPPPLEGRCLALLERNSHNRVAFEYLMGYYLLSRQLDKLAAHMSRLDELGYGKIPRHFAEAIVIYQTQTDERVDLGNHWVDPDLFAKFSHFANEVNRYQSRGDAQGAKDATRTAYGNSYFYYFAFGRSGEGEI